MLRRHNRPETHVPLIFDDRPSIPLMAGFECSSFRRSDGVRLDMIAATDHEAQAEQDFRLLRGMGISSAREGLRWHLIERERGCFDWSSADRIIAAARSTGIEIIWDLLHFGLPDWVNPFHPDFPHLFENFASLFAERAGPGIYVPVNEISFMAWAAGDVEYMYPYSKGRGSELKQALCRASIAAIHAIRRAAPGAMIMAVEPMIRVHARTDGESVLALQLDQAQFEAIDMLIGRTAPELGGAPSLIDILGVNHYPYSQWFADRTTVPWRSSAWTPLSRLLLQIYDRYQMPILLAETGCEGEQRATWLNYVISECAQADRQNVPLLGICLYPILSHIAWTGERFCPNGLWDDDISHRQLYAPLAEVVLSQSVHKSSSIKNENDR
jgi:Beta-galactosidase